MKTNKIFYQLTLALSALLLILIILVSSVASAATLNVGPTAKYKTIQKAADSAQDGDTIKVAYGTYHENVRIEKYLTFLGTKYPKVDGFTIAGAGSVINGFSIQKYGIVDSYTGAVYIRNNYFYNCGVGLAGGSTGSSSIINNQITGGIISLYDAMGPSITITGNTISKSKCGLYIGESSVLPTTSKNTFKNCRYGVYFYSFSNPGRLDTFTNNKYINNKVNLGWGTKYLNDL